MIHIMFLRRSFLGEKWALYTDEYSSMICLFIIYVCLSAGIEPKRNMKNSGVNFNSISDLNIMYSLLYPWMIRLKLDILVQPRSVFFDSIFLNLFDCFFNFPLWKHGSSGVLLIMHALMSK